MKSSDNNEMFGLLKFGEKAPGQPKGIFWDILPLLFGWTIPPIIHFLSRTLKFEVIGKENVLNTRKDGGYLFGIWHGSLSGSAYYMRDKGLYVLSSPHYLSELIGRIITKLGYRLIRASSGYNPTKGFRQIIRKLREDEIITLILDGPDGPAKQINASIVQAASVSGRPIILSFSAAKYFFRMPTWDRSEFPLPFQKVIIYYSEPIYIPRKITKDEQVEYKDQLEKKLFEIEKDIRSLL